MEEIKTSRFREAIEQKAIRKFFKGSSCCAQEKLVERRQGQRFDCFLILCSVTQFHLYMYKTASIVLTLDFLIELIIRVIGCRDWPFDDVVIVFSVSRVTLFSLGPSALLGLDGRAKINTFIFGTSSTHVKCIGTKGGGGYRGGGNRRRLLSYMP